MTTVAPPSLADRTKDLTGVTAVIPPIPHSQLSEILLSATPAPSPINHGTVSLIVERPAINLRNLVPRTVVHPETGMPGSGWVEQPSKGKTDQICVMSTSAIRAITASEDPEVWATAGDQFFFDFELGKDNLRVGELVRVGQALLRVSQKPHTGCAKFSKRFGVGALKIVACPLGKERRIRGIYFEVVEGGVINVGDEIVKVEE